MVKSEACGQFEQMVLTAIVALGDGAYGITIHNKVQDLASPRKISLGAVYVTLDRMEDKGFVSSTLSDPTPERGGRAKRCYQIEHAGLRALRDSTLAARRMWDALCEVLGDPLGRKWGKV